MSKKFIIPKNSFDNLVKQMDGAGLTEVTYESSFMWGIFKTKSYLSKQQTQVAHTTPMQVMQTAPTMITTPATTPTEPISNAVQKTTNSGDTITSPMVGVVYFESEPGAKPFITIGDEVKEGATICLVEAMKTFNPVKANKSGIVVDILPNSGDTVEFGSPLAVIN